MALFWRSGRSESPHHKHKNTVPVVENNQPLNPFTEIKVFTDHTDIVRHLLQVDAKRCLSSADDCSVILWDVVLGLKLYTFVGHTRPVSCMLCYTYDNTDLLVTGSSDKTMRVWNLHNGHCVQTINEHASNIKCLVRIPSSNLFCSGCEQLCLWNSDWEIEHRIKPREDVQINHVLQLSDNRLVVSVASELMVYKVVSSARRDASFQLQVLKNCLPPHRENIRCLVNISDSCFGSASLDGAIRVWATRALNYTQEFNQVKDYQEHCNYPHSVQYLLPIQERYLFAAIASGFSLYDVFTGNCLVHMPNAHFSSVTSLSMVYGGEFLATSSEDGTIRLWSSYEKSIVASDTTSDPVFQRELSSFFGSYLQTTKLSTKHGRQTYQPSLLGECVAHSGGINTFLDYGQEGLISCGADSLLIMWKDGIRQSYKRNNIIRENLFLNGFKDEVN